MRIDTRAPRWPVTGPPDLRDAKVSADGMARLVGVALCATDGNVTSTFQPGQVVHFCFEFEAVQPLRAPIGGVELRDASGMVIHGRTSLQDGAAVPPEVPAGSRLRFRQVLRLDVAPGDYWFSIGLSSADQRDMARYRVGAISHVEMDRALRVHCRADGLGPFLVGFERSGRLLHYGLVNLAGAWEVTVAPRWPWEDPPEPAAGPGVDAPAAISSAAAVPRLVYLASYPRSGNTWVRNLVEFSFDRLTSTVYDEGAESPGGGQGPFVEYRNSFPPVQTRRRLAHDCKGLLDEGLRRQLGAGEEHFFLKTHELPFRQYVDGEGVVYVVRHPAASAWSYYNYLRKRGHADLRVEDVIEGQVPFGSWSRHVDTWLDSARDLGPRFALLRYEALGSDESRALHLMARLTGLPRRSVVPFPRFDFWQQGAPDFFRRGEEDDWRVRLTPAQVEMVRRLHGSAAERVGYRI